MALVEQYANLQNTHADVRKLFHGAATYSVELSAEWFDNLQDTVYGHDRGVSFLATNRGGATTAVLPVRFGTDGHIRTVESLSNYYTSLYQPILSEGTEVDDLSLLVKAAARINNRPLHVMNFHPMDRESLAYSALLRALRRIGWRPFPYFCFGNWYLRVDRPWREYLKQRDGALRSTIKRKGQKFLAEGGEFTVVHGSEEAEKALNSYNAVYSRSWKGPEPYPAFISGLVRWLANEGKLRLGIASIAGQAAAAQIWITNNKSASIYKLAYDEAFSTFAPGTLLTAHLMEHAIDRDKVSEVDYLIGDDNYKKSWMSDRRERWGIVAYNPRSALGLALLFREMAGRIIKRLPLQLFPRARGHVID
jgi:hypothetical protein